MPQGLTGDKSTLVQVMAWCHQATSHYLNQCWPRSMSPYGVTRPQRVIVHISSRNGLVLSGNKPLLNQCWPKSVSLGYIELNEKTTLGTGIWFHVHTLRPQQNGEHFADKIFLKENYCILIKLSVDSVLGVPLILRGEALIQLVAWCLWATSHYLSQCWQISNVIWHPW